MKKVKRIAFAILIGGLCLLWAPSDGPAYLDPGTGSYLFQILIAGLVGGLFVVKIFWAKIKEFFAKLFGRKGGKDNNKAED